MRNLDTADMEEVGSVFVGAVDHVLGNLVGESQKAAEMFIGHVILKAKPYMILTSAGVQEMVQYVFGNETHRDFVLSLAYVFFARWGGDGAAVDRLAANIADGCSHATNTKSLNAIPTQLRERLAGESNAIQDMLRENKWLIVVLLLSLFVTYDAAKEGSKS